MLWEQWPPVLYTAFFCSTDNLTHYHCIVLQFMAQKLSSSILFRTTPSNVTHYLCLFYWNPYSLPLHNSWILGSMIIFLYPIRKWSSLLKTTLSIYWYGVHFSNPWLYKVSEEKQQLMLWMHHRGCSNCSTCSGQSKAPSLSALHCLG